MVTGMKMSALKAAEQRHSNDWKSTGTTASTLSALRGTEDDGNIRRTGWVYADGGSRGCHWLCLFGVAHRPRRELSWKEHGRIERITATLSTDGKSIDYQKVYKDEQSFNEYTTEASNAMETEATKLNFDDAWNTANNI